MKVLRFLAVYDKKSEDLIELMDLSNIDFKSLKTHFRLDEDDPLMYNNYWLDEENKLYFEKVLNKKIDLEKYIYQVEAHGT